MGHLAPPNDFGGAVGTPKILWTIPPPKKIYPYLGGAVGTPNDFGGVITPPQNKCSLKKNFGGGGIYPPQIEFSLKKNFTDSLF